MKGSDSAQPSHKAVLGLDEPATRQTAFYVLRLIFGLIWVFNALYQMHPAYINRLFLKSIAAHPGQSHWYFAYTNAVNHLVQAIGAPGVAMATVAIAALLALSLLTGFKVRFFAWIGVVFTFVLWMTTGHMGGPYTPGATDPGTLIIYTFVFVIILLVEPPRTASTDPAAWDASQAKRFATVRLLFGLLWAFDASWKWTPFFLHHAVSYLVASEAGQPAWMVAYIHLFIEAIDWIGPTVFGVFAALSETAIALGLLLNRGLRYILPFGLIYSFVLWTSAEGFGGPYGAVTGIGGDVLGTTIIYCLIFLYLMAMYPPHLRLSKAE